jgi:hypothetical protein
MRFLLLSRRRDWLAERIAALLADRPYGCGVVVSSSVARDQAFYATAVPAAVRTVFVDAIPSSLVVLPSPTPTFVVLDGNTGLNKTARRLLVQAQPDGDDAALDVYVVGSRLIECARDPLPDVAYVCDPSDKDARTLATWADDVVIHTVDGGARETVCLHEG